MPLVPSQDEFDALVARVAALEGGAPPPPPQANPIITLFVYDESGNLVWESANGQNASLNGGEFNNQQVNLSDSKSVPEDGTTYTLTVTAPGTTPATASVTVPVEQPTTPDDLGDFYTVASGQTLTIDQPTSVGSLIVEQGGVVINRSWATFKDVPTAGLVCRGSFISVGTVKTTWLRLDADALAGATALALSAPVEGWNVGDRVVLPDTRQLTYETGLNNPDYRNQWETAKIAGIAADRRSVTLESPLAYSHRGATIRTLDVTFLPWLDGLSFMPHVGNLSRTVGLKSENPNGHRGHCLFTEYAEVRVEYTELRGLGRTLNAPHSATNVKGEYPLHAHHLHHPFRFVGNSVWCGMENNQHRWGIVVHNSHNGEVRGNVVYNWAGAGIVTEDGSETGNVFADNFVLAINGTGGRPDERNTSDTGYEGAAFWFRGYANTISGNVAACSRFGYLFWANGLWNVQTPGGVVNMMNTPLVGFDRNEAYGGWMQVGLSLWSLGSNGVNPYADAQESVVNDLRLWHIYDKAYYGYETNRLTFDRFVFVGDRAALVSGGPVALYSGDYVQKDFIVRNSFVQNAKIGFSPANQSGGGTQRVIDTVLDNYINVRLDHIYRYGSQPLPGLARETYLDNCLFSHPVTPINWNIGPPQHIVMLDAQNAEAVNFIQRDQLFVSNYNRVEDDFQVFYAGQAPSAIVPDSQFNADGTARVVGLPAGVTGLNNSEAWTQYGIAVAGEVAPADAEVRDGILGLVRGTS